MSNSIKKAFIVTLSLLTAMWSVGVSLFAPQAVAASSAAATQAGDLVKASLPAVYYVGMNEKRYVFPNQKTYMTWWSNFDSVQTISDAQLAAIAIGGNVTYRPSAKLVKITTDPKVYMVGAGAMLYAIDGESTAMDLYGSNWNTKIDDVPDAFFTNYSVASSSVSTAALGALPAGTLVMYQGSYYLVGPDKAHKVVGSTSMIEMVYKSVVMIDSSADFSAWVGMSPSAVTSEISQADIMSQVTPDRMGNFEGGSMGDDSGDNTPGTVSLNVLRKSTDLQLASSSSQSLGVGRFELCLDSTRRVDSLTVSSAGGTIGFNNIFGWFEGPSGLVYELGGTESNDVIARFEASDADEMYSGCGTWNFFASTNQTSGILRLSVTQAELSGTGSSAAAMTSFSGKLLVEATAASISASDMLDFSLQNAVPNGNIEADGTTLQQLISVQFNVSNNDAYVPNIPFELSGDIITSNCELRLNGKPVTTDMRRIDDFYIFAVPEANRTFKEGNHTWEMWCKVLGEAGQTVTPQITIPSPEFYVYDANRTRGVVAVAAGMDPYGTNPGLVISPNNARTNVATNPRTITGASITAENKPLDQVKDSNQQGCNGSNAACLLDSDQTSGATNKVLAVYRVRVRGSAGTLSSIIFSAQGTLAANGFTNCQVKIGQRSDKAQFDTVDMADFALTNFGAEVNVNTGTGSLTVTSTKKMGIGDWLLVLECDVIASSGSYTANQTLNLRLDQGSSNFNFDTGGTTAFPAADVAATAITIRLLSAVTVNADNTLRYLVGNAKNKVIGTFNIVGPTQEGILVTSIGVTFAAGISGTSGCTTVVLADETMKELTNSQTLNSATTLTFSVSFEVNKNEEFEVNVVCNQASGSPVNTTVTGATTFATMSVTGQVSNQAVNASPSQTGANVLIAEKGTVAASIGTNKPNELLGPDEVKQAMQVAVASSVNEDEYITSLTITLTVGGGASGTFVVNEIKQVEISIEGAQVAGGVVATAPVPICTRQVTGTGSPVTLNCTFSDGDIRVPASNTANITVNVKGNAVGNIGLGTTPAADLLTPSFQTGGLVVKGVDSQIATGNVTGTFPLTGRVFTPSGSTLRVVNKALPSTTQPGQTDMILAKRDVIVGKANITLNRVDGNCNTSDLANVCVAASATNTIDLVLDSTVIASGLQLTAGTPVTYSHTSLTNLLTIGTHDLESRLDAPNCTTSDTVQLTTNRFDYTSGGQVFANLTAVIPDFNTFGSNNMQHPSNLCG